MPQPAGTIAITYAWGHESTGDMAIAPGLVRLVHHALPGVKTVLYAAASGDKATETGAYLQSLYPELEVYPDIFGQAMGRGTSEELWWRFWTKLYRPEAAVVQIGRTAPQALSAWLNADLRLFNSSMQLTYDKSTGANRLAYWLPNALSQQLRLPYALWSQSFGEIEWPGEEMLRLFLSDAVQVTARDDWSLSLLASLDLPGAKPVFTADPILFFDQRDPAWAKEFLAANGLHPGRFLVVLPRTYEFWGRPVEEHVLAERMRKVAAALRAWIGETGQQVLIGYELPREKARARELLLPLLAPQIVQECRFVTGEWQAQQALAVFDQASAMLSMERYSVYLGLTAGVPVLHITSNAKSLRMDVLNRMGLGASHLFIDQHTGEEVAGRLRALYAERERQIGIAAEGIRRAKAESMQAMRFLWNRARVREQNGTGE